MTSSNDSGWMLKKKTLLQRVWVRIPYERRKTVRLLRIWIYSVLINVDMDVQEVLQRRGLSETVGKRKGNGIL